MIHLPGTTRGKRMNMRNVLFIQLPSEGKKNDRAIYFIDAKSIRHTRTYKTKLRRNLVYIYLIIRY